MNVSNYTLFCQKLAHQGGKLALKRFKQQNFQINTKSDNSLQTSVDLEIETLIRTKISTKFPDHSIFGEEKGLSQEDSEYKWFIDPIDGTSSYVLGLPLFCTMVALTKNNQVIASSIYDPSSQKLITAEKNQGAYLNQKRVKSLKSTEKLTDTILFIDRNVKKANQIAYGNFIAKNAYKYKSIKSLQGVGIATTMFASRKPVMYAGIGSSLYDFIPPLLIVQELGGLALNRQLQPWQITKPDWIFFCSKKLLPAIKKEMDLP